MTPAEIRDMSDEQLIEALDEAKEERFNLRFQLATNQLDNHARIKDVKKDIARILTALRERDMASSVKAEGAGAPAGSPAADAKEGA
ncbi:MAG: 50S ribosomal protein L29 [Acidimicrobiia bacterium]